MNKLTQLIILAAFYLNSQARAVGNGAVLESACAIVSDNAFQTVDLSRALLKRVEHNDVSETYKFSLRLVNCEFARSKEKNKYIIITFIHSAEQRNPMGEKNIKFTFMNENGRKITPGVPSSDISIHRGRITINYVFLERRERYGRLVEDYQATMNILFQYI